MRKTKFAPGNYYHLYNRGASKQDIFLDNKDYLRFLFLLLHMQGQTSLVHTTRLLKNKTSFEDIKLDPEIISKIIDSKIVELVAFVLMPNHFHILMYELEENGISRYMQRLLNSYTKFINTKYERSGHLFQGPFGAVHVKNGEQLLYLSAYIHSNPNDLRAFSNNPESYTWSSYPDYIAKNRWPALLKPQIITDEFNDSKDYIKFVRNSGAKNARFDFKTGKHDTYLVP